MQWTLHKIVYKELNSQPNSIRNPEDTLGQIWSYQRYSLISILVNPLTQLVYPSPWSSLHILGFNTFLPPLAITTPSLHWTDFWFPSLGSMAELHVIQYYLLFCFCIIFVLNLLAFPLQPHLLLSGSLALFWQI